MGKYFGTDGFRGEANVNLTVDHAFKIGKFLGYYYGKKESGDKCRIAIGKDTRRSSYMFEYAIAAGITSTGADESGNDDSGMPPMPGGMGGMGGMPPMM